MIPPLAAQHAATLKGSRTDNQPGLPRHAVEDVLFDSSSLRVRPGRHASNVLACEVADSTGELTAVFYGRTHIPGLEPGRRARLRGMAGVGNDGRPAMINPAYELLG